MSNETSRLRSFLQVESLPGNRRQLEIRVSLQSEQSPPDCGERLSECQICFRNADDLFWRDVRISRAWSWSYVCYRPPNFPALGAVRIFVSTGGSKEQRNDEKRRKFHERFERDDIQFGPQLQTFYPEIISVEAGSAHFHNRVKLLLRERHHGKARVSD